MGHKNQYLTLMSETSPVQTLEAVIQMIATNSPSVVATIVRPDTHGGEHTTSLLAEVVAGGGVAPLAEVWISLLHLLYEKKYLSGQEVISALLPHKKYDTVKSLAHAIAGAAWSSKASTKLCALLSEITRNDELLRKNITKRLSMKQPGYGFKFKILNQWMDFYKRAKHADMLNQNAAAIGQLKEGHLIPENRKLYNRMGSGTQGTDFVWESSFEVLQKKIKEEIAPQIVASYDKMKKEKAELEKAKISARRKWEENNAREKKEKKKESKK